MMGSVQMSFGTKNNPHKGIGLGSILILTVSLFPSGCDGGSGHGSDACPRCEISVKRVVILGDEEAGIVDERVTLTKVGDRYWVSHRSSHDEIQVFDKDGTFVELVGRPGSGPGEFSFITSLTKDTAGNVLVADVGNRRLTTISPAGEVIDMAVFPISSEHDGILRLPGGSLIVNGFGQTPESAGYHLHRWTRDEGFLWSAFEWIPGSPRTRINLLTTSSDAGTVWVGTARDTFRLLEYDLSGQVLRELQPSRDWFEGFKVPPEVDDDRPVVLRPTAMIWSIWASDGLLWVLGNTADPEWETYRSGGYRNLGAYLDSVLEAYDVRTGDLLASRRFAFPNAFFERFTDDGLLVAMETLRSTNRLSLWDVALDHRP